MSVNRPLQVSQLGQLSLSSLPGRKKTSSDERQLQFCASAVTTVYNHLGQNVTHRYVSYIVATRDLALR